MLSTLALDHNYHKPCLPENSNDLFVSNLQENDQENLGKNLLKTRDASVNPITPNDCNRIHFSNSQTKICDVVVDAATDKRSMIEVTEHLTISTVDSGVIQRVHYDFLENVCSDSTKNTEREDAKNVNNSTGNTEMIENKSMIIYPKSLSLNNSDEPEKKVNTQDKTGSPVLRKGLKYSNVGEIVIKSSSVGVPNDPEISAKSQIMRDVILELTRTKQISTGLKQLLCQITLNDLSLLHDSVAHKSSGNGQTTVPTSPPSLVKEAPFNQIQCNCITQSVYSSDKIKSIDINAKTEQTDSNYGNSNKVNDISTPPKSAQTSKKNLSSDCQIQILLGIDLIAEVIVQLLNLGQTKYEKFMSVVDKIRDEKVLDEIFEFLNKKTQDKTTNCNIISSNLTNQVKTTQKKEDNHGAIDGSNKGSNTITDKVLDQNAVDSDKLKQKINKCFEHAKAKYNVTELKEFRIVASKISDSEINKRTGKIFKSKSTFVGPLCKKLAFWKKEKLKAEKIKMKTHTSKTLKNNSNVILESYLMCDKNISLSKKVTKNQSKHGIFHKLNATQRMKRKSPIPAMKQNEPPLDQENPINRSVTRSFISNIMKSNQSKFDYGNITSDMNVPLPNKMIKLTEDQVIADNQSNDKSESKKKKRKCTLKVQIPENENTTCSFAINVTDLNQNETDEANIASNIDIADKEYFPTATNVLKCKFCKYSGTCLPIVEHYKEMHKDEEVLPSRVSDTCAKKLINDSVMQKLALINCEQLEKTGSGKRKKYKRKTLNTFYTCIFCCKTFDDINLFSDHTASHTGEYSYQCEFCNQLFASVNHLKEHRLLTHSTKCNKTRRNVFRLVYPNLIPVKTLFGYLCPFCNFTQLNYTNMTIHMGRYHSAEDKKPNGRWTVIRINMSFDKFIVSESAPSVNYSNLVGCQPPLYYKENHNLVTYPENVSGGGTSETLSISLMNQNRSQLSDDFYENLPNNHLDKTSSTDMVSSEYILKKNVGNSYVFSLFSCLQFKTDVLFQCLVPKCIGSSFSTVSYSEFLKHIQTYHKSLGWNGICNVCMGQTKSSTERVYMLDALQHLVEFHLILCNENQPSTANAIVASDTEQIQNTINYAIERPTKTAKKLRVRHLPGDMLSSTSYDYPQNTWRPDNLQLFDQDISVEPINNNEGGESVSDASTSLESDKRMNKSDRSTAMDSIRIYDVRTIKEFQDDAVNTGKSVSNGNTKNNDVVLEMPVVNSLPRQCEDLLSIGDASAVTLRPGQQIVNNGQLIDGEFEFINTDDKTSYENRFEHRHIEMSKSVYRHTMNVPGLFKCLEKRCGRIYTDVESYKQHMIVHYSQPKPNKKKASEKYKLCCYCYKAFDNVDSLIDHIIEKYTHCLYFCQYCLYRAYTPTHVLAHEAKIHPRRKLLVIQIENDDQRDLSKEKLLAVDYNKFVLPYTCDQEKSCSFSCYVVDDFITHLHDAHGTTRDTFNCYECTNQLKNECNFSLHQSTIMHFEVQSISTYQCIFCLFGADSTEKMILHMSMEHFEYGLICVERSLKDDCSDSTKIENLKTVRLESSIHYSVLKKVILPKPPLPEISPVLTKIQRTDSIDGTTTGTPSFNNLSSSIDYQNLVTSVKSSTTIDDNGQTIFARGVEVTRPQCSGTKRKRSVEDLNTDASCVESVKLSKCSQNVYKRLSFTPRTVDQIPKSHILSEPLSCGICLYSTKVRSNLLKHLEGHDKGQAYSTVEIFNPVPPNGNSKQTVNEESSSSARSLKPAVATAKKTQAETKSCVEILPPVNFEQKLYPKLVEIPNRYKCPVRSCIFTGNSLITFKQHLTVKHTDYNYFTCPHCPEDSNNKIHRNEMGDHVLYHGKRLYRCYYCPYIHFQITQVKTHQKNIHLSQIVKDNNMFGVTVLRGKTKSDHSTQLPIRTLRWTCNICNVVFMLTSDQEIEEHNARVHDLTKTYKCSVCSFEHDYAEKLKEHFKTEHPLLIVKYLETYKQSKPATTALKRPAESPINTPAKKVLQKLVLTDNFDKNASLGTIKSTGHYLCPKCNEYHTKDVNSFREHVYKEIDYKLQWKCTGCGEISDSLNDMRCWADNRHGTGNTSYELIEDEDKFNWVEQIVKHQSKALRKFNEKAGLKNIDRENEMLINGNVALAFEDMLRINQNENRLNLVDESYNFVIEIPD